MSKETVEGIKNIKAFIYKKSIVKIDLFRSRIRGTLEIINILSLDIPIVMIDC